MDCCTTTCPQPELANVCRAMLDSADLDPRHWFDDGPDATVQNWLSCDYCPPQLSQDQWVILRICAGIWAGQGGPSFAELLTLGTAPLHRVASYLNAYALADGCDGRWASIWHRS